MRKTLKLIDESEKHIQIQQRRQKRREKGERRNRGCIKPLIVVSSAAREIPCAI
jgi:hypothetical protein